MAATAIGALASSAEAAPGQLRPVAVNTEGNNFGYIEYLPRAYDESQQWPVLIFLTGIGENGTGQLPATGDCRNGPNYNDPVLCRNLRHGPANLIWQQGNRTHLWNDVDRPFIIISPQNPAPLYSYVPYNATHLDTFVDYIVDRYAVDPGRIYLTGMSMGGYSATLLADHNPDRFAAIAVMPGINGVPAERTCNLTQQNIWVFHGQNDTAPFLPLGMVDLVTRFDACPDPHPNARLTIYSGAGHDVWTRTFLPTSGMNSPVLSTYTARGVQVPIDPYNVDIYSWLMQHDKPFVDAGADLAGSTGETIVLEASIVDDDTVSTTWTQTSGPATTLVGAGTSTASFTPAVSGAYGFSVRIVDADGQWDSDDVLVTVFDGGDSGGDDSGGDETSGGDVGGESSGGDVGGDETSGGDVGGDETSGGDIGGESSGAGDVGGESSGAGDVGGESSGAGDVGGESSGAGDVGGDGGETSGAGDETGSDGGNVFDPLDALDDDFSSGSLAGWTIVNPNAASAQVVDGRLVVEPGQQTVWWNALRAIHFAKTVEGNFSVVANVTIANLSGGAPSPDWRLAALLMRDPSSSSSNTYHGALGTVGGWMSPGIVFEYQSTVNGLSQYAFHAQPAMGTSAQLRLCRVGSTVRTMYRASSSDPWILGDERQRTDFGPTLEVGPSSFNFTTPANMRATFDDINFTTIGSMNDCAPGTIDDVSSGGVFAANSAPAVKTIEDIASAEGCACSVDERRPSAGWMLLPLGLLALRGRRRRRD